MGKIIILEGPDGAGKTTLGLHLQEHHGFKYHHEGVPPPRNGVNSLLNYYGQLLYDAHNSGDNVVFDRLHLGETIYGPICRHQDQITDVGVVLIERLRLAYGAIMVICLPDLDVCRKNWLTRKGSEYVPNDDMFARIYERYKLAASSTSNIQQKFWFDYTRMELAGHARVLANLNFPQLPDGVVGTPRAPFLFVGEIANQEYLDVPFFSLQNSSDFLNKCLWEAGFSEELMAFTNALTLKNEPRDLAAIVNAMGPAVQIICLGGIAVGAIKQQLPNHGYFSLPHPAYWKRFHSRDRYGYIKKLQVVRNVRLDNAQQHQ